MTAALPDAVVFDFDTETPIFVAYEAALAELGHAITVEAWAACIGLGDADSFAALCEAVGADLDREALEAAYRRQDRSWRDTQPALPGVEALLDELDAAGVPAGIASSSPTSWIEGHLARLGLLDRFATIAGEERVGGRTKPLPDTYLLACRDLDAAPARSVALEDSGPGCRAALAAGMAVVVVPSTITRHTDLSHAHHRVPSLAHVGLADLAGLLDVAGRTSAG